MEITDAIVLARKRTYERMGDVVQFRYLEEIDVEGVISSFNLDSASTQEETFTVNGKLLGTGIIKSVAASAKNQAASDTRRKISFTIFANNSYSLSNEYPGIPSLKYVKSFSESSSYDLNGHIKNYNHNVNVKLTKYVTDGVSAAKSIANTFFSNDALSSAVGASYSDVPQKVYYDEVYDEVNAECAFTKKFEVSTNPESTSSYNLYRSLNVSYDSNGIITATENAEYQDLTGNGPPISVARGDIEGAQSRVGAAISYISSASASIRSNNSLNTTPVSKGFDVSYDERNIKYHVTYSNNIRMTDTAFYEYTTSTETTNAGITYKSIEGNIVGYGTVNSANSSTEKYNKALSQYRQISFDTSGYKPHSFSTSHNQFKGTISFSIKYTNCASVIGGAGSVRRKIVKTITEPTQKPLAQTFKIINQPELLLKSPNNIMENHVAKTYVVNGSSSSNFQSCLGEAGALTDQHDYIQSTNLSYSSSNRQLTYSIKGTILPG